MTYSYDYPVEDGVCDVMLSQYDPELLDTFKLEMSYGIERFFLLSYCLACCWPGLGAKSDLRIIREWAELDFVFPSEAARQSALENKHFVKGNSVPIDVDVHHRQGNEASRIFVTIPRFDEGRPVTLGTVDEQGRIAGYPDYSWNANQGENCNGLTSVFRVAIDKCNRLWVMDTGKIGDTQHCPPQLLAFSLANDQLIFRHKVNGTNFVSSSLFVTPPGTPPDVKLECGLWTETTATTEECLQVVDIPNNRENDCSNTFVYVADVTGFGLLVVDVDNNRSWRVSHRLFFPFPNRGTFTIEGESFELMDGVLGMALSPYRHGRDRYLYFHALASTTENVVRTSILRNDSFIDDPNAQPQAINVFPEERPNQSAAEAIDRNGVMFFGLMDPPSIWCWNTATEFSQRNFHRIALNRETLQFASGVKVVNNLKGEQELWVLTSSFQKVMTGSINSDSVNYRIHAEKIPRLLHNSPCKYSPKDRSHGYHANLITPVSKLRHSFKYGAVSYL